METSVRLKEQVIGVSAEKKLESAQASIKPQFVSIVAYVHNDKDKIHKFIEVVMECCQKNFKQCEIIFVDDFSSDNSVDVIKEYYKQNPVNYIVSIIKMGRYHGIETAMNAGRDMAIGDYVYEFDDLYIDFNADIVLEAYDKCLEGNDIVTVSTDVPIRYTSKLFYKIFNKAISSRAKIGQESFRLLSRRGINRITSMDVHIPYRKVIYLNCGLSTAQITYKSTTGSRPARITQKYERFDLAMDSFIYFTNIAERLAMGIAAGFGILSIFAIVYAITSRLMGYREGIGWLSTMLFVSLGFMGMFGILALVVKYLSVVVDLVFKSQKYLIADIDKISSK